MAVGCSLSTVSQLSVPAKTLFDCIKKKSTNIKLGEGGMLQHISVFVSMDQAQQVIKMILFINSRWVGDGGDIKDITYNELSAAETICVSLQ